MEDSSASPYVIFDRTDWSALRGQTPMTLGEQDIAELRGIEEALSLSEVEEIYLPLSRLLNLHISAIQELHRVSSRFLGTLAPRVPYVIAIAGSVSVGKSTTARVLRTLLSRWPDHPRVDLVTTDGFLYPNRILEERGMMDRKGFPESYDRSRLVRFVQELKSGRRQLQVPVYSHLQYDVLGREETIDHPDIVIIEGLNVLQGGPGPLTVFDFVDFSIYVDAEESNLEEWFLSRFKKLRATAFRDPTSYFHAIAEMPEDASVEMARGIWARINLANLRENIAPTRDRARLILVKGQGHAVENVLLRRL